MKIHVFFISILLLAGTFFPACDDGNERKPINADSNPPEKVSNVVMERLPGAIRLTYDVPADQNLAYVKAECMMNGKLRQAKSSSYQNTLMLEGFADSSLYTINLYSVNKGEVASEPVTVQGKPLNPSYIDVFNSLELVPDFGGATAYFENQDEADLAISVVYKDDDGYWETGETSYTSKLTGKVSLRGFEPVNREFGVCIMDRWDNMSDTLSLALKPFFEKQLDRTKFAEAKLPGDEDPAWGWVMPYIWDGDIQNNTNIDKPGFHTSDNGTWPQMFTFDMGVQEGAKLSRFKFWQRGQFASFSDRNIRKFELYGSMDPNPDGSLDDSWTLLLEGESIKPSGLPDGQMNDEDWAQVINGDEFTFSLDLPLVRYIRMRVTETWTNAKSFYIMQVAFWGQEPSDVPEE